LFSRPVQLYRSFQKILQQGLNEQDENGISPAIDTLTNKWMKQGGFGIKQLVHTKNIPLNQLLTVLRFW
jgi:hypothetical protein